MSGFAVALLLLLAGVVLVAVGKRAWERRRGRK